jgi:hypothetical protein
MKHRGPGASLTPAIEAARVSARAVNQTMRRSSASSSSTGVLIGDWWLTTDEGGALVADHLPTHTRRTVLLPPGTDNEQEGTQQ